LEQRRMRSWSIWQTFRLAGQTGAP
jgi:hypothetical protein